MRRKGLWRFRPSSARNPVRYRWQNRRWEVDRTRKACRCQAAQAASCKIRSTVSGQRRGDKYGQSWLSSFRFTVTAPIMRRSFHECCREGPAHTSCADNDNLFHASPSWPLRQDLRHIRLVDTFNNESVIGCPLLAVLRDTYIAFAVIPILSGFHVREFRNDDSLDRIAFKDFMLSIG